MSAVCPECKAGKCVNCDGTAMDDDDNTVRCECTESIHTPRAGIPYTGHDYDGPLTPYPSPEGPTSGFSGTDTSEQRARTEDADGTTSVRQQVTMGHAIGARFRGITVKDLRELTGWHHGRASSALSVLHKEGLLCRLTEVRDRCHVYVVPGWVAQRETQPHGRTRPGEQMTEEEAVIDVVARRVIANSFTPADVVHDFWDSYPEIGEYDWLKVTERIGHLTDSINPSDSTYNAAYAELEGRTADE